MQFKSEITVLKAQKKSFVNTNGQNVEYIKTTFINEDGAIITCTCSQAVLDTVQDGARIDGTGTFEITSDFKGKPRLVLTLFEVKPHRK